MKNASSNSGSFSKAELTQDLRDICASQKRSYNRPAKEHADKAARLQRRRPGRSLYNAAAKVWVDLMNFFLYKCGGEWGICP
jgi:hypothetical protein